MENSLMAEAFLAQQIWSGKKRASIAGEKRLGSPKKYEIW
jgi:hypothetical protein